MDYRKLALTFVSSFCLGLAACGGDDSTGSSSDGTDGTDGTDSGSGSSATDSAGTDSGSATDSGTSQGSNSGSATSSGSGGSSGGSASATGGTTGGSGSTGGGSTGGGGITCDGLGTNGLIFHSTLDDAASVTTPAVGSGGTVTTTPADDFQTGAVGNAVMLDAAGELVRIPQAGGAAQVNVDPRKGTADFCYSPNAAHTAGGERAFFQTEDDGQGGARLGARLSGSNNDSIHLFAVANGTFVEVQAFGTDYTMSAGEWYRITLSWDFTQGDAQLAVYLDGVALPLSVDNTAGKQVVMPAPDANSDFEIGAMIRPNNMNWVADGLIDDFKIYDAALVP